jgi:hypothetical protein
LAALECFALHLHIDLDVLAGGCDADVTEPSADHIEFDASWEKMQGGRVTERMGADPLFL